MATATKAKKAPKASKPVAASKPATKEKPATQPPTKPQKKAKKEFTPPTPEEQEASDTKFYTTAAEHGLATENPRTGKRLSRFIIQAHALAQCWPAKPLEPAAI